MRHGARGGVCPAVTKDGESKSVSDRMRGVWDGSGRRADKSWGCGWQGGITQFVGLGMACSRSQVEGLEVGEFS